MVDTDQLPNIVLLDDYLSVFSHAGSHNAITYCLDKSDRSPVDLTQPDMLQKLDKYMKPLIRPFVYKWAVTQVGMCSNPSLHFQALVNNTIP